MGLGFLKKGFKGILKFAAAGAGIGGTIDVASSPVPIDQMNIDNIDPFYAAIMALVAAIMKVIIEYKKQQKV